MAAARSKCGLARLGRAKFPFAASLRFFGESLRAVFSSRIFARRGAFLNIFWGAKNFIDFGADTNKVEAF
ncbi:MAG: hypothetical protein DBY30_09905 [Verrucomicrobia bacterium]|nr:MAG: hypothetical protein DBY30_09905 [Verrucomicrobiota bacterium]